MQHAYVLGIDIGTGSTKAVAVTHSGAVLATAQEHYGTLPSDALFSEQVPEIIWNAFVKTIQAIRAALAVAPQAISLSSCMHSLILLDENHELLTPNITWADRRSAALADTLRTTPEGKAIYQATGTPLHAMSPLCKLQWFRQERYALFKKMAKAISIKEYIWYKLFGVYEIDYAIASATGLFDIQQLAWFQPSLDYCGIRSNQLSTPVATHFTRHKLTAVIAAKLQFPENTTFCIGASDGCLANVGSHALQGGTAAVTIGTSGAVRVASKHPVVVFPEMIFNYRLNDALFISGGAVNNGGNMVQWLLQQFLQLPVTAENYNALFQQTTSVPPSCAGLFCLPYLNGERTPLWDEKACGVFLGVRPQHTQAYFIRAALEGVCFALYGVLKKLEAATGTIHTLHVSGGMVHSQPWMQLLADVTGKTLRLLQTEDASAIGAALLYLKASGTIETYEVQSDNNPQVILPDRASHVVYEKAIPLFEALYTAIKPAMHLLPS